MSGALFSNCIMYHVYRIAYHLLKDMDLNGVSTEADESLALSSYEIFIKGILYERW